MKSPSFFRLSLEAKLPLLIGGLLLTVIAALSWSAYLAIHSATARAASDGLRFTTTQVVEVIQSAAQKPLGRARAMAADPSLRALLRSADTRLRGIAMTALANKGSEPEDLLAAELLDSHGRRVLAAGTDTAAIGPDELALAREGPDAGGIGRLRVLAGVMVFPAIVPIADRGQAVGYVVQWRRLVLTIRLTGIQFTLGNASGDFWTDLAGVVPTPALNVPSLIGVARVVPAPTGPQLAAAALVPTTAWVILLQVPERAILGPVHRFLRRLAVMAGVLLTLGVAGGWLVSRRITSPLKQLTEAAETIAADRGSRRVALDRADELGRLATAFNLMVERLEGKVAELEKTQARVVHAQRMEAVGRLAAGVAHDFNNLLTVIFAETDLAVSSLAPDDPSREPFTEIRRASEQAASLTRQLLAFSRRQLIEPEVFSVNDLVHDVTKMLQRLVGEDIQLETRPTADRPMVKADHGQLEQVVMNLVVNARDALPRGGRITLTTQTVALDEDYARNNPDVVAGEYVMLAVSDTGTGMTEDVKAHVFEPFFTTKERGRGTGLGLATSYGIVKQGGGHIALYSELGVGTTAKVYLPLSGERATAVAPARGLPSGNETVLLVEDELAVRRVAARMLRSWGYQVHEAGNGGEALAVLTKHPEQFHLLLTDVVLPGMAGRELAEHVLRLRPGIKVLFASGYTDDVILQRQLIARDVALLQKPFTAESLSRKVRSVLDAG